MGSKNKSNQEDTSSKKSKKRIIEDPRFASVHLDPRFQNVPKHKSKVSIDSRFNSMFTDKSFASSSAPSDKRGKPKVKNQNSKTSLSHYYQIDKEEKENREIDKLNERKMKVSSDEEDESEEELENKEDNESEESEKSESEDDVESSGAELSTDGEDDEEVVNEEDTPEAEVENIPVVEQGTHRLGVVNMDWRHVTAVDLFVVLHSFLPKGGEILSVAVYPSEFGLQRMKEEEVYGPVGLFDDEKEKSNDDDDDNDNDEISYEKLRDYEKSRLRYYYAVVECDSIATADHLYKACDGLEFERSSNVLDLRFIPDSMEFKHPPRDVATEAPASYKGLDFHTKALQHSNIPISWDEDEPQRVKTLKRKFNADQLAELEFKEFLASDESESDDDENDNAVDDQSDKKHKRQDRYRALIESGDVSDGDDEEGVQDVEITFNTGLEAISKHSLENKHEKIETVWDAQLRKGREKKKARKNKSKYLSEEESSDADGGIEQPDDFFVEEPPVDKGKKKDARGKTYKEKQLQDTDREAGAASREELELLLADDKGADNGLKGYNLKRKKAKGKKGEKLMDEDKIPDVDYNDPRFSKLFTSPLFALDPTDPQFKRSAAYARQVAQREQKGDWLELMDSQHKKQPGKAKMQADDSEKNKDEHMDPDVMPSKKQKSELSSLVGSVKLRSRQLQLPCNGKMSKKDEILQPAVTMEMDNTELSTLVQSVRKRAKGLRK